MKIKYLFSSLLVPNGLGNPAALVLIVRIVIDLVIRHPSLEPENANKGDYRG